MRLYEGTNKRFRAALGLVELGELVITKQENVDAREKALTFALSPMGIEALARRRRNAERKK